MGFFQSIGKSLGLSDIARPGKWNIGTALNVAGLAQGGTNALIGGALGGVLGGGKSSSPTYQPQNTNDLLTMLLNQQMTNTMANEPKRQQALGTAFDALTADPASDAMRQRNKLMQFGDVQGRRDRTTLRNRGYASGVGDAAMLNAQNQANMQGNQAFLDMTSPLAVADRNIAAAGLFAGGLQNTLSGQMAYQSAQNQQRLTDLQYSMNRPPTFLESLIGIGGQVAPLILDQQKKNQDKQITDFISGIVGFGRNTR